MQICRFMYFVDSTLLLLLFRQKYILLKKRLGSILRNLNVSMYCHSFLLSFDNWTPMCVRCTGKVEMFTATLCVSCVSLGVFLCGCVLLSCL